MRNNYSHSHKITSDTGIVSYQPCYGQHDWMKKVDWKGYVISFLAGLTLIAVIIALGLAGRADVVGGL